MLKNKGAVDPGMVVTIEWDWTRQLESLDIKFVKFLDEGIPCVIWEINIWFMGAETAAEFGPHTIFTVNGLLF